MTESVAEMSARAWGSETSVKASGRGRSVKASGSSWASGLNSASGSSWAMAMTVQAPAMTTSG
ncbi:MAG TPA: hypothetical protein VF162_22125 [Streptosporangiaceae bacterium]